MDSRRRPGGRNRPAGVYDPGPAVWQALVGGLSGRGVDIAQAGPMAAARGDFTDQEVDTPNARRSVPRAPGQGELLVFAKVDSNTRPEAEPALLDLIKNLMPRQPFYTARGRFELTLRRDDKGRRHILTRSTAICTRPRG